MPNLVETHPAAIQEAASAVDWYTTRNSEAVEAFAVKLDRAIEINSESPERWPTYLHGTRRYCFGDSLLQLSVGFVLQ